MFRLIDKLNCEVCGLSLCCCEHNNIEYTLSTVCASLSTESKYTKSASTMELNCEYILNSSFAIASTSTASGKYKYKHIPKVIYIHTVCL